MPRTDKPQPPRWSPLAAALRAPVDGVTWRALGYVVVGTVLGVLAISYLYLAVISSVVLAVTLVGIPLAAGYVALAREWGRLYRWLARTLLRIDVSEPDGFRRRQGALATIGGALSDRVGWRALAFLLLNSVVAVCGGYLALMLVAVAAVAVLSPLIWWIGDPINTDSEGVAHHSFVQFGDFYFDSAAKLLLLAAGGALVLFFVAPWPIRGVAALGGILTRWLLGSSPADARVRQLERSRSGAVEDAAATLRRVERDLHDGTQARLVTIGMTLGRAQEKLDAGEDAGELVAVAHATTKDSIRELRDLVRGIHPPALDLGLGPALETLTARNVIPTQLSVHMTGRPSPGVETIAYFCVAELLTNVGRHSGATTCRVEVDGDDRWLRLAVHDDGRGGAETGAGSGLAGLTSRVETVDGSLTVHSPAGGPTTVTVDLPTEGVR
ncbi:sensor histidine kinase [Speluncibacter jeojiensis]|uniref:histidine kinase n=1 Tax=Speluncibacter jeojiensis TaxID=2710754 RepID=A0A9X4M0B2_9ACTN|nr:sensor domain-containing protein [Corynebacteriales bacterium D3-21]